MRKREIERLSGALQRLPGLERYVLRDGRVLTAEPLRDLVIRGFFFNCSPTREEAFDFEALVLPLYVPVERLRVGLSRVLGSFELDENEGEDRVVRELAATLEEGFAHHEALGDYRRIADRVLDVSKYSLSPRFGLEYRAYSLLLAGDHALALEATREAEAEALRDIHGHDEAQRCRLIRGLMESRGPAAATEQLLEWSVFSADKLGVPLDRSLLTPPAAR